MYGNAAQATQNCFHFLTSATLPPHPLHHHVTARTLQGSSRIRIRTISPPSTSYSVPHTQHHQIQTQHTRTICHSPHYTAFSSPTRLHSGLQLRQHRGLQNLNSFTARRQATENVARTLLACRMIREPALRYRGPGGVDGCNGNVGTARTPYSVGRLCLAVCREPHNSCFLNR